MSETFSLNNVYYNLVILLITTFYVIDFCIIPHFGKLLTHAVRSMSYLYDIINLSKSDNFPGPL